jgi:hypothetical protein
MHQDRKVVAWTPFGRTAPVSILFRYMQRDHAAGILDEWLLCMNAYNDGDIGYAHSLAAEHDWINLLEEESPAAPPKIARFYQFLTDKQVIYLRFDDDIVYVHDQAMRRMADATLTWDGILAAFPVIINNAVVSYHLQREGKVPFDHGTVNSPECLNPVGCSDPVFAEGLHRHALSLLEAGRAEELFLQEPVTLAADQRFSVNAFGLSGIDVFPGVDLYNAGEEGWMTQVFPGIAGKRNMIVNDALVAHFSFHPTWEHMRNTDIMSRYDALSVRECDTIKA